MMKRRWAVSAALLATLFLAACGRGDIRDGYFDADNLAGELNILFVVCNFNHYRDWRDIYARLFNELHPDVRINFEAISMPNDMAQRLSLTTRLIADPPDMLFFSSSQLVFEKMDVSAIFADLYDFFDSPRGIDRDNYFSNIFRAAETDGGLYHLPIYVNANFGMLNKRLFEGIGASTAQISSLTIYDELGYFLRIMDAFPNERLFASDTFSLMTMLGRVRLYDLGTMEVFADTPEMYRLFEKALLVPVNGEFVSLSPEGFSRREVGWGGLGDRFLQPSQDMLYIMRSGLQDMGSLFLENHPRMQFSRPVRLETGDGDFGFFGHHSVAIMRNAASESLAWEFLRFIIEMEDDLVYTWTYDPLHGEYFHGHAHYGIGRMFMPINRARFDNQAGSVMRAQQFFGAMLLSDTELEESHRYEQMNSAMSFLRDSMERITYEIRVDWAVLHSLVYPDIWLLYSGQQDIATTLSRIQNRLELYVHE